MAIGLGGGFGVVLVFIPPESYRFRPGIVGLLTIRLGQKDPGSRLVPNGHFFNHDAVAVKQCHIHITACPSDSVT